MKERNNKLYKFIDKYLGGMLVLFLGGLSAKRKIYYVNTVKPLRFALIKTSGIGDGILLSSIVNGLRSKYPSCYILFVCFKSNYQGVTLLSGIDEIFVFNPSKLAKSFYKLRSYNPFDFVIDFGAWPKINALIAYLLKSYYRVGFRSNNCNRHYIYDVHINHRNDIHEVDNYFNLINKIFPDIEKTYPMVKIDLKCHNEIISIKENCKYIIFHPFASGSNKGKKEWPYYKWVELANQLIKKDFTIFITGGDEDIVAADTIIKLVNNERIISLAGKLRLDATAVLLKNVGLLISVNTGIMHLGAAVGARVIALHGPTNALRWGPIGKKALVINSKKSCAPCLNYGFENLCNSGGCMESISVGEIYRAVLIVTAI